MVQMKIGTILFKWLARAVAAALKSWVALEFYCDYRRSSGKPEATSAEPNQTVYFIDGYHGGATFWDWIVIPGGETWKIYNWPVVAKPILKRLEKCHSLSSAFEIDGHTFSVMTAEMPEAIADLRKALDNGRLELVNGTFAQPLAGLLDGESYIRHFYYGRLMIREALAAEVQTFAAQEPSFFPQLPQILNSFRYQLAILRTHWAPFGSDPSLSFPLFYWQAPDGSRIKTIPRYPFMHYGSAFDREALDEQSIPREISMHYGPDDPVHFMGAHLLPEGLTNYNSEGLEHFRNLASDHDLDYPLLSRFEDFNILSGAPLKEACSLAASGVARFITPTKYLKLLSNARKKFPSPIETYFSSDDFPCYYPYGLMGDAPLKAAQEATYQILEAEQLDTLVFISGSGEPGNLDALREAWKSALQSQHHDLHLCSPWHSRLHSLPMGEIAVQLATAATSKAREVVSGSFAALTGARLLEKDEVLPRQKSTSITTFNSLPFRRRETVIIPLDKDSDQRQQLICADGVIGATQSVTGTNGSYLLYTLELPPFKGETAIFTIEESLPDKNCKPLQVEEEVLFTGECYQARLTMEGELELRALETKQFIRGGYLTVIGEGQIYDSRLQKSTLQRLSCGPIADIYLLQGSIGKILFEEEFVFYRTLPRIEINVTLDCGEGLYFGPEKKESSPGRAYYMQNEKKLNLNFHFNPASEILTGGAFLVESRKATNFNADGFAAPASGSNPGWSLLRKGTFGCRWEAEQGLLQTVLAWAPREWLYASDDSLRAGGSLYARLKGRLTYRSALHYGAITPEELISTSTSFARPFLVGTIDQDEPRKASAIYNFLPVLPPGLNITALFREEDRIYIRLCNYSSIAKEFYLLDNQPIRPVSMELKAEGDSRTKLILAPGKIQTAQILMKE